MTVSRVLTTDDDAADMRRLRGVGLDVMKGTRTVTVLAFTDLRPKFWSDDVALATIRKARAVVKVPVVADERQFQAVVVMTILTSACTVVAAVGRKTLTAAALRCHQ